MKLFHSCHIHTPMPVVKSLACILLELFLCSYKFSLSHTPYVVWWLFLKNKNCIYLRYPAWYFDKHISSEMIIIVELITISIFGVVTFFLVVQSPEICCLSKFLVSSTVLLAIAIMLDIRLIDLFILHYYHFVPFDQHLPISSTSCKWCIFIEK